MMHWLRVLYRVPILRNALNMSAAPTDGESSVVKAVW
jgi:hypothetical protein